METSKGVVLTKEKVLLLIIYFARKKLSNNHKIKSAKTKPYCHYYYYNYSLIMYSTIVLHEVDKVQAKTILILLFLAFLFPLLQYNKITNYAIKVLDLPYWPWQWIEKKLLFFCEIKSSSQQFSLEQKVHLLVVLENFELGL